PCPFGSQPLNQPGGRHHLVDDHSEDLLPLYTGREKDRNRRKPIDGLEQTRRALRGERGQRLEARPTTPPPPPPPVERLPPRTAPGRARKSAFDERTRRIVHQGTVLDDSARDRAAQLLRREGQESLAVHAVAQGKELRDICLGALISFGLASSQHGGKDLAPG